MYNVARASVPSPSLPHMPSMMPLYVTERPTGMAGGPQAPRPSPPPPPLQVRSLTCQTRPNAAHAPDSARDGSASRAITRRVHGAASPAQPPPHVRRDGRPAVQCLIPAHSDHGQARVASTRPGSMGLRTGTPTTPNPGAAAVLPRRCLGLATAAREAAAGRQELLRQCEQVAGSSSHEPRAASS